jgi:hypothetical protein
MLHQKKIYFFLVWLAVKKKDFWTGNKLQESFLPVPNLYSLIQIFGYGF